MRQQVVGILVLLIMVGCGAPGSKTSSTTPSLSHGPDPWKLICADPNDPIPALLWNGQIGIRVGRDGTGLDANGKPLPFFMIDEYEVEGEEQIRVLANPFGHQDTVRQDNELFTLSPTGTKDYQQVLEMKAGILQSFWTQSDPKGRPIEVLIELVLHPNKRIISRRVAVDGLKGAYEINGHKLHDSISVSERQKSKSISSIKEFGDSKIKMLVWEETASNFDTKSRLGGLLGNTTQSVCSVAKTISFGISPNLTKVMLARGMAAKLKADSDMPEKSTPHFDVLFQEVQQIWADRWKTDIVIDGPIEDQQAIRSFLFYLRSGLHPESPMAISPLGLSGQTYKGHVFWDADTWVFPVMALIDPKAALAIPQYRLQMKKAAQQNFWNQWGKSLGIRKEVGIVQYPWESSVSGLEVSPSASRKQLHVTGSVAKMLDQASALGLADPKQVQNINTSAAKFYLAISTKASVTKSSSNKEHEVREIKRVMSPDEYRIGDNDLYTNMLAQWLYDKYLFDKPMEPGMGTYPKLEYKLPQDEISFLTYDDDPLKMYQQAAAVLAIYPLQHPKAEAQAEAMMNRFADKVEPEGPAMSHSIHALIWARLGKTDKAYETWRKSWQEYTQHPLLLFSEKRSKDVTYFTTGAAGCLKSVIFGILNLRLDDKKDPIAPWATPLNEGKWLTVRPSLPKQWKSVTFKNFSVLGKRYTLTATPEHVQVTPGG